MHLPEKRDQKEEEKVSTSKIASQFVGISTVWGNSTQESRKWKKVGGGGSQEVPRDLDKILVHSHARNQGKKFRGLVVPENPENEEKFACTGTRTEAIGGVMGPKPARAPVTEDSAIVVGNLRSQKQETRR